MWVGSSDPTKRQVLMHADPNDYSYLFLTAQKAWSGYESCSIYNNSRIFHKKTIGQCFVGRKLDNIETKSSQAADISCVLLFGQAQVKTTYTTSEGISQSAYDGVRKFKGTGHIFALQSWLWWIVIVIVVSCYFGLSSQTTWPRLLNTIARLMVTDPVGYGGNLS